MKEPKRDQALEVVASSYDKIGERYNLERSRFDNWTEIKAFSSRLPAHGKVLDAGCGTGIPIARFLDESGFAVCGIDISAQMVAAAKKNVPEGAFQQMNMLNASFPPESFDGVISCYAIIHNPMENHAGIFSSFHSMLKPRGMMLVSVASWQWEEFADYLGETMFGATLILPRRRS